MINHPNLEDQKAGDGSTSHDLRKYSNKPQKPMFKKIGRFFKKIGKGEGVVGKVVFSVLDVAPIPNVHEIVKSVLKDDNVSAKDGVKIFFKKIDWTRTVACIVLVFAVIKGWLSMEQLERIIAALSGIL